MKWQVTKNEINKLKMSVQLKKLKLMIISLITTSFTAGCQYQENSSVRDDVLVYCSEGSPETFNPQLSTSGVTFDATSATIYNRLVEFKSGSTQLKPALATSWKVSKDGREYTFKLRKNVAFHTTKLFIPTRTFNADDVLFSFQKQWFKNHPFYTSKKLSGSLGYSYFESMGLDGLIENIIKIDPYTIKFRLSRAESPFLATLAMDFASILSAEYAQNLIQTGSINNINNLPVGTGPFQLTRYQPDAFIRYKAHPNYWQGKAKFKHLVYAITPDPSLRFARLVAGECDVMSNPLPIHIKSTSQFDNVEAISSAGLNISFLSMNTQKKPFDNRQVRLAINHAINKEAIIKAVYQETATAAVTAIPPNMWAYNKKLKDHQYNPEKARRLLKKAGYPNGFEMEIWTTSAQRAYNPNAKKMAELIQQNLASVNIEVKIITYEFGTLLKKVRRGEHLTALMGWNGDNGDPDNFFTPLLSCASTVSGTNSAFWCDQSFNQLIFQARSQFNSRNRQRLYNRAQKIFKHAVPWVPIAHATQHLIYNPRVKNLKIMPSGVINFDGITLKNNHGTEQ